jgi:acyl carrier protein
MENSIESIIETIIAENCVEKDIDFGNIIFDKNLNLIESGIFDSLGFLQFIASLEEKTGKEIDFSEYDPEEFTNYARLLEILNS